MTNSLGRPCSRPGCPALRPCEAHARKPFAVRSYRSVGGRAWQRTRERILARDGYRCCYCGGPAEVVDHIINRAHGGNDDDANLAAACRDCNERKRCQEARDGRGIRILLKQQRGSRYATISSPGIESSRTVSF